MRLHTFYRKVEIDPSPVTMGDRGTDTTSRDHKTPRTATRRLSSPILGSPDAVETEKGQKIEEEKKDAAAGAVSATYRTEDGRSPPKGKNEKSRSASGHATPPNHTSATTTTARWYIPTPTAPTTAEAGWATSNPHYSRSGPRGCQSESNHGRYDKDSNTSTPCDQGRPGPDTEYPRGPDIRGNVLNLRILYWNPGGIIGKTRKLCDLAQLEDVHIILLGETKLQPEQELRIPNIFAYRHDEISARGPAYRGTAVLICHDLMQEAEQLTDFETMRSIGIRDVHATFSDQTPTLIIDDLIAKRKAWGSHSIYRAGRLLMEDAERHGYEALGPDTFTHVPTDMRHRPDVLDIVIGHKIRRPMHVEFVSSMDTHHLLILVTVGTGTSNAPQATLRQRVVWENFETFLEALHLGPSFETAAYVEASANLLVDKKKETQARPRLSYQHRRPAPATCPRASKGGCGTNAGYISFRDFRGATWEAIIDRAGESARNLNQLCRQLTKTAAPKCPVTVRSEVRHYDAKA
ncbi:hypothetical protein EVAR_96569_1 [Eumeta japonica]|uniref:Uncharacterized protein n=1 Tax=Eumeta variegata TaxID=151549 RepID=A0A4C1WRJ0_EUMVA|nr:hypothetical protein EVAR_96569_1 [Eumeta japonica]